MQDPQQFMCQSIIRNFCAIDFQKNEFEHIIIRSLLPNAHFKVKMYLKGIRLINIHMPHNYLLDLRVP